MIEQKEWGTVFTGPDVQVFALLTLRSALGLEVKGISLSRGMSAYRTVKSRWGFRGSKQKVYDDFTKALTEAGIYRQKEKDAKDLASSEA